MTTYRRPLSDLAELIICYIVGLFYAAITVAWIAFLAGKLS